jgi:translation initiation factor 2A
LGTYIITWQRSTKDENGDAVKNLKVWLVIDEKANAEGVEKETVARFVQKSQTGWNLQYTYDETFCARVVTNEIQIYQSHDLTTVWNKIRVEGVSDFAVSPGKNHSIAVFVPERKVCGETIELYMHKILRDGIGTTSCRASVQRAGIYHPNFPEEFLQG